MGLSITHTLLQRTLPPSTTESRAIWATRLTTSTESSCPLRTGAFIIARTSCASISEPDLTIPC